MTLTIKEFPDELRWKLRRMAMDSGVTLRDLVIKGLRGVVGEGDGVQVEGRVRAVGEKIKGQMERISGKLKEAAADEMEF